ncbi:MAG: AEC family transporter [Bacteroidales bacterium]|nr:AEC family transporter [Bacteroidales bacterium]
MDTLHHLIKAILVIILLYVVAISMRWRKILSEDHSLIIARIVTDLCLPAMIFVSLAGRLIRLDQLGPALEMLLLELLCVALAWFVSYKLKFSKEQQGAVVFCSAFGSSAFLGYPLIIQMFPEKAEALTEAVLISEIGVGYPIFILGPVLASYFGSKKQNSKAILSSTLIFLKSPVFIALVLGVMWGHLQLPGEDNEFLEPFFKVGNVLAAALTPMAILSVGLMFKLPAIRKIILALFVVVFIKLLIKPVIAGYVASLLEFPDLWRDVLIILAAMPPAILGAVFLRRYGGDATLASTLVLSVSIISIFTILAVYYFIG